MVVGRNGDDSGSEPVRKHATTLLATAAFIAAPLAIAPILAAPTASADICAGVHGRFVGVAGCGAPVARAVGAGVAIAAATDPYIPGEIPCYTVEGVPYYTPPGQPC
ncbi:Uncharacterised protein [Mycobacteroides abscessus subsp. abscessus]|uniref:Uncharacterized protein n=1 Tax=Mycobacteroides abscessus subsp. abscessus TaxID=1185650 RepID=A0AB38D385_9MYCO|nr:hypothetical protein [Mycobacteroides abscessus]MBN7463279.1 hypothetical protein [Mycobacteroides abscessus subsp. abscessus]MBE5455730.1 hypothetical protein [Mycobacteroides abscessus]MBN7555254.1 hypothetical protein [Mycobacteroides abscessus subsp. abscessus]OTR21349.1 hypothetical protein B9M80_12670 [Mycobacteroides abscessus]